jgi:hypothetical protein
MYWRNEYGRYFHGKWISWRQECCGCFFWLVAALLVLMWIVAHVNQGR